MVLTMRAEHNQAVAEVLREIAELLELKGESPFRIRAYENAARIIEALPEDINEIAGAGRLQDISGVGEGLATKIDEFLKTGHITYLDNLRAEFPAGVRELMRIPGVGPKLASRAYHELGIASIDDLEAAARDGRLASLPRLGQKTAENVLHAIERMRAQGSRIPIGQALPLVEALVGQLSSHDFIHNLTPAGSVRRFEETIGDIDMIATSPEPQRAMDLFVSLPEVREVIAHGPTKTSIIASQGVQVDFRIVQDEAFGSLLQHFTGSKEHNVQLRDYALHKGLSLSEYGITNLATGQRQMFADEVAFYHALDLPWFPPEIRQGNGEIEAALKGQLPHLVEVGDIKGDLHVHTDWSDGTASLEDMVAAAAGRGYQYIAITDHSAARAHAHGLSIERLKEQWEAIAQLQEQYPNLRVLRGSEVDILNDGTLDFPDEILEQLDWVVASIHANFTMPRERMTERLMRAIENPHVDAIGHPTGRILGRRPPYELDIERILVAAAKTGTALEVNSHTDRLDLKDSHVRRAVELGVCIVINTDAHAITNYDNIVYGVRVARRGWARPSDVLNTRSLSELECALGKRLQHTQ
jgi:DNA polymerase (family 10)